ncbi:UdgX family uracil-DNA binding protein [Pararhizobium sp.]|uniref:UdgX family uracil-DNA binding protein n=1 Tax=Pararhizobium sp. TaxID=1977563 RepID=UPI0027208ECF|nr:UdgX family uracil-DNA binding protein [Pararhizobium sp.]MDO9418184.1 UdgX family uracil-DNA binding protein [Pararhizobium sp.]
MRRVVLRGRGDFGEWRDSARDLLMAGIRPGGIDWQVADAGDDLLSGAPATSVQPLPARVGPPITVPRAFVTLAETVICHSDPCRFGLLYRLLWRLQADRNLLAVRSDADVADVVALEKSVRRDSHKMKAFVRFKEARIEAVDASLLFPEVRSEPDVAVKKRRQFIAWFEPDHFIVARTAPFFQRRFTDMDWMILTPHGSAGWDGTALTVSDEPAEKPVVTDATDDLWRTYFANIFNPARLKIKAMQAEMPKKYWKNLPEAGLIPQMIADAEANVAAMVARQASQPPAHHPQLREAALRSFPAPAMVPAAGTVAAMAEEARGCQRCPIHAKATQTVFGEGPADAEIMFVGEQAGDHEDLAGKPFIGPAGKLLDTVLAQTGIDRGRCYVTNAVKHFKYEPRGKRRLHQRPTMGEVDHCRWWLQKELALIRPKLVVALGATAFFSLTRSRQKISDVRGRVLDLSDETALIVTVHPAYLLRLPDEDRRAEEMANFRRDMALAQAFLAAPEGQRRLSR